MKALSIIAGLRLSFFSLVSCVLFLIALVDPAGAQMADDSDPFGTPPSLLYSASGFIVSAIVGVAGLLLVTLLFCTRRDTTT